MANIKSYFKLLNRILFVCLILFSSAPCSVKVFFSDKIDVVYEKPINKTKSTSPSTNCQLDLFGKQQKSSFQKSVESHADFSPIIRIEKSGLQEKTYNKFSSSYSGNSPPKYILYQRLKIAIG